MVPIQGHVAPLTLRLKKTSTSNLIDKVLNSEIQAFGNLVPRDSLPEGLTYFADRAVGGHPIYIHYGHTIDYVHEVLRGWEDFSAVGQIQRPWLEVLCADGNWLRDIKSDVPDYLSVHGTLKNNKGVTIPGAILLVILRLGPQFKCQPGLTWTINGKRSTIAHHNHALDEVKDLGWDWPEWQKEYGLRAKGTAKLFERYADWVEIGRPEFVPKDKQWSRLHDGVVLLQEFDNVYKQIDPRW